MDTLFHLQNRIILFDLTNLYFEGAKRNSRKAKFGRSKERRNDCKLLVLALSINTKFATARCWKATPPPHCPQQKLTLPG
ncbi:MAG: hypothetical protein ACI30R_05555 [Sodaliphilus sp.]